VSTKMLAEMMKAHTVLPSTGSKKPRLFYGYIIVWLAFLIILVMYGTLYSFGVFFKPVLTELSWTRAVTSGAYSLNYLLLGGVGIAMGRLNDKFGPRVIVVISGSLLGLGYLLMSQISAIWQLYLFYGVMIGIGMSGGFVPMASTVARWFVKRRGLMTGILVSGLGIGTVVMPLLASGLMFNYGWRISYVIVGIIALVVLLLVAQFLRRDPSQVGQLPYGESEVKQESLNSQVKGLPFQEVIHTKQFWMLCTVFFCHGVGQQATFVHIVPHAIDVGIPPIIAARILAVIGGLTIIGTLGIGSVIDRIGSKRALIIVLILVTIALLWLAVGKQLWELYLSAAIFGFAFGGIVTAESPIVAEFFGLRAHGTILGMVIFALTIGCATGPLFAGMIFDMANSYYLAFLTCVVLSIVALILTSVLKPIRKV